MKVLLYCDGSVIWMAVAGGADIEDNVALKTFEVNRKIFESKQQTTVIREKKCEREKFRLNKHTTPTAAIATISLNENIKKLL